MILSKCDTIMKQQMEKETVSRCDTITEIYSFTPLQIEVAKLRVQCHTFGEIATIFKQRYPGKKFLPNNLNRGFNKFLKTASHLREGFLELQAAKLWDFLLDRKELGRKQRERQLETQKQLLLKGFWPFGKGSGHPWGIVLTEEGKMSMPKDKQEAIQRIFKRVADGESPAKVARDENVNDGTLRNILKNPYYIGYYQWRGTRFKANHDAIVDKKTWDTVQEALSIKKPTIPHFGFHRTATGTETTPESLEMLKEICRLRSQRKSYGEIAATLKLKSPQQAWGVVHDPFYKNVVGTDLWEAAHAVKTAFGAPILKRRAYEIKQENQTKILLYLQKYGPSKPKEIAKALKLSDSAVHNNLRKLKQKKNSMVTNESGKWHLLNPC
jgi:DNA invertase Pin-like site-specific DNA recombinase